MTSRRLRSLLRDALVMAVIIAVTPLWLPAWLERRLTRGAEGWFILGAEMASLIPGKPGIFTRRAYYRMTLDACALDVHIGFGTLLAHPDTSIASGVYIGHRCSLGKAIIERDVTIGSNVDILSGRRQHHFDQLDRPVQQQGGTFSAVRIGADAWLGNSSVIMADVGQQSVVGAGSVVVKPIASQSVAVGNPAQVIRSRAA